MSGTGYLSVNIANQALISLGHPRVLGSLRDGSKESNAILEVYAPSVEEITRAAHWNFARRQAALTLLNYQNGAQTGPGSGTPGMGQWLYEYAWPIDCMKARFVPWSPSGFKATIPTGNIAPVNGSLPLMGGLASASAGATLRPARWLEATDTNYPAPAGALTWEVQGVSPQGRSVILTNVQNAVLVYTGLMNYPSNWDSQFRAAFVAYLASEVAFAIWSSRGNPKMGMAVREAQMKLAAAKIMAARVTDGNEGWHNADFIPDWMRVRNVGGGEGGYSQALGSLGGGAGILYGGCDACCGVGNTSAF